MLVSVLLLCCCCVVVLLVSVLLVRWVKCVVGVLLGKVCCWYVVGKFVVGKWVVSKSVYFPSLQLLEMTHIIKLHTYQFCHCLAISYISILPSTM